MDDYIDKKRLRMIVILGVMLVLAYLSLFFGNQYFAAQRDEHAPNPSVTSTASPDTGTSP